MTSWLHRWEWFQQHCGRQIPPRPQTVAPTLGVYAAIGANARNGLQVRPTAVIGPGSLAAAGSGCYHCSQRQYGPKTLTWPLILGIFTAFKASRSMRHQHRHCSWAMDNDMILSCILNPDIALSLSSGTGCSHMLECNPGPGSLGC